MTDGRVAASIARSGMGSRIRRLAVACVGRGLVTNLFEDVSDRLTIFANQLRVVRDVSRQSWTAISPLSTLRSSSSASTCSAIAISANRAVNRVEASRSSSGEACSARRIVYPHSGPRRALGAKPGGECRTRSRSPRWKPQLSIRLPRTSTDVSVRSAQPPDQQAGNGHCGKFAIGLCERLVVNLARRQASPA